MTVSDTSGDLEQTFYEAEQNGLRLAIKCRIVALILIGVYLVSSRADESLTRSIEYALVTGGFAVLGGLHYIIIGSRFDRAWLKYAFVTIDLAILSTLVATQPLFATADVPQAMIYRDTSFLFYFVVLGVPGELATMPPLVSDKARDNETSSDSCLDQ